MLEFKIGNILDATENIICHQVNCQGVMGSGLAKQLRNRFPTLFSHYKNYVDTHDKLLGDVDLADVGTDKYVANLFGQNFYGTDKVQTDYISLCHALEKTMMFAEHQKYSVAIPYKLGCGLAGGDWAIVMNMISDLAMKHRDVPVSIYILQ